MRSLNRRKEITILLLILILSAELMFPGLVSSKVLKSNKIAAFLLLFLILVYQLIYIGSVEYYFVFDTRESMSRWIQELFKGQLDCKLARRIESRALTPEMALYKKSFGTYSLPNGDTLLYKKME